MLQSPMKIYQSAINKANANSKKKGGSGSKRSNLTGSYHNEDSQCSLERDTSNSVHLTLPNGDASSKNDGLTGSTAQNQRAGGTLHFEGRQDSMIDKYARNGTANSSMTHKVKKGDLATFTTSQEVQHQKAGSVVILDSDTNELG